MPREAEREYRILGNLGEAYRMAGNQAKAALAYRRAIAMAEQQLNGTTADGPRHASLGLYYAGVGEPGQAREQANRAIELQPASSEIRYLAAAEFAMNGEKGRALAELRQALERGYPLDVIRSAPLLSPLRGTPEFHNLEAEFSQQP